MLGFDEFMKAVACLLCDPSVQKNRAAALGEDRLAERLLLPRGAWLRGAARETVFF